MRPPETGQAHTALLELALLTHDVARYCDHVEHNEEAEPAVVLEAGRRLCRLAASLSQSMDVDLVTVYVRRLSHLEESHPLHPGGPPPAEAAFQSRTWRHLQLVQADHDRHYHPDIFGLPKYDQLRHCLLHLAKLTGRAALLLEKPDDWSVFAAFSLPDALVFGLKLPTVMGKVMPDEPIVWGDRAIEISGDAAGLISGTRSPMARLAT